MSNVSLTDKPTTAHEPEVIPGIESDDELALAEGYAVATVELRRLARACAVYLLDTGTDPMLARNILDSFTDSAMHDALVDRVRNGQTQPPT